MDSGTCASTKFALRLVQVSISRIAGSDQENNDWNISSIKPMKIAKPNTGCNSTRSTRSDVFRFFGWASRRG